MRLIAFGGDERLRGALDAAARAGWETLHITGETDVPEETGHADAVMLPWPHSFREDRLVAQGEGMSRERVLALVPPCRVLVHGAGVSAEALPQAGAVINPSKDETFLRTNARLTAEGAIAAAMGRGGRALLGRTALVTGFGRIGQELTVRLVALGAFVIVCARNEEQMRCAHGVGAHPVPLAQVAAAAAQADVLFNTVPARVLGQEALESIRKDARIVELASAPYGEDIEQAARIGLTVDVMSGVPGRYAPMDAGAALFALVQRSMNRPEAAMPETDKETEREAGKNG